jgi:AcrR family transcriptional regulator
LEYGESGVNGHECNRANDEACLPPRGRNAAATRQAILDSARWCFARDGYDQVGVRDIAARAGADPALVNRYFGSKEGLFAEAVSTKFDLSELFAGDRAMLGERLARYVVQKKAPSNGHDPLIALLRSSSSEVGGGMLRDALVDGFVRPLAARLDGPDAVPRAELVGSILLGLLVYRTIVGGGMMQNDERLIASVARTLQALIDGSA